MLLVRGPQSLFVGWEPASSPIPEPYGAEVAGLRPFSIRAFSARPSGASPEEAHSAPPWPGASLVLQLYRVDGVKPEAERVVARRRVGRDRRWYVWVRGSGRRYRAKIGWRVRGAFRPIAVSAIVTTPVKGIAPSSARSKKQRALERAVYELLAESGVRLRPFYSAPVATSPSPRRLGRGARNGDRS